MRKILFLLAVMLLGGICGVQKASAYTTDDLVTAGWTLVSDEAITGNDANVYVLVDAKSSAYVMANDATHFRPCYKTLDNPLENPSFVWNLEGSSNSFDLKSASTGAYFKQASGWNTSMGYARDGRTVATCTFTLNSGKYDLKCIGSNAMVGHWNDGTAGVESDGENIAANKSTEHADGFFLYAMSKSNYIQALAAARATAVAGATKDAPVEVTSWLQNPDWSGDWGGWENTFTSVGNMQWGQQTLEAWNSNNVVVKQEIMGVPDGLYKLTGDVISGNGDNLTAYVFATGATEVKSAAVSAIASAGNYSTMSAEVAGNTLTADNCVVTNGIITVGIKIPAGWIVTDNFKLYYMGEDMSMYVEAYHAAKTDAEAVDQEAPMNATALSALQTAISTYGTGVDETSKAALLEATDALSSATTAATNSIDAYAAGKVGLDKLADLLSKTNVYTEAAYTELGYDAVLAAYNDGSWTNEEANAYTTTVFGDGGWRGSNTIQNLLLSSFDVHGGDYDHGYYINTWSIEGNSDGSGYTTPFIEYWTADGNKLGDKTIHAQMTGLPNGTYKVSAFVRLRLTNGQEAPVQGLSLQISGGEASAVSGELNYGSFYVTNVEAEGKVGTDGVLDINFNVAGANSSWVSIKDVKYTRTGDLDPSEFRAEVAAKLEVAQGLVNEVMNADVEADLNAKIAATAGYEESIDIDALIAMATNLETANEAAAASIANYKEAAAIINAAGTLDEAGQAVYESNNKVLEVKAGYDNKTLVAVTDEQKADCQAALVTATKAQTTEGSDWTTAIINPGFEGSYASIAKPTGDRDIYQPEGWTVAWTSGNENDMTSLNSTCTSWNQFENMIQPADGGDNVYWIRYRWGSTSSIKMSQVLGLPAGVYQLAAEGLVATTEGVEAILSVTYGKGAAQTQFTESGWGYKDVMFYLDEADDNVEFAYTFVESAGGEKKAGVDNFGLTYVCSAATLQTLRGEISDLITAVEALGALPEPLATEASNAIAEANSLLENNVLDLNMLNASKARLEAVIEAASDFTSYIVNAALTSTDPKGFDDAGTKGIDGTGIVKAGNNAQYDFKQTVSLPAGQYKLTAQAAYRYGGDEQVEYDAIQAGATTKFASLYAAVGTVKSSAFVQNRYDGASDTDLAGSGAVVVNGKYVPNSSSAVKAWFEAGKYVNEVTFNMTAAGDVTIGIEKTAQPEVGDYTVIGPWTLTRIGDPDLSDYYNQINTLLGQAAEITGAQSAATSLELKEAGEEGLALVEGASTDVVALQASIDRLTAAVSASQASVTAYAALQTALNTYAPKAAALDEAGQAAFDAAGIETGIAEGTYSTEEATALAEDMPARFIAAVKAQTTIGSDWTELINNWDFLNCENGNFPGWTIYAPNGGNTWKHGDTCVEYWIGNTASGVFDYYQTITDLPAGKYSLSASMWNTDGTVDGQCGVYATSGSNTVFAGVTTDSGDTDLHTYSTENIVVTDGTLRLGVKNATTMGARWFGVDWIKLTYQGAPDLDSYYEAIADLLTEASGMVDAVMQATVAEDLNAAIAATAGYTEITDIPTLQAMIDGLTIANATAAVSIEAYQEAAAIVNAASTLDEAGQASYNGNESVLELKSEYEARTLYTVTDEQRAACQTALKTAVKAQTTEGSDWTLLIENPGFETGNTSGWTVGSSSDTGARSTSNATYAMEGAEGSWLFNTWWQGIPLTQNIGELPAGEYKLSAMTASDGATVYLIANGEHNEGLKCTNAAVASLNEYSFKLYSTGEVTIGVVGGNDNGTYNPDGYWWYKADVFKLTLVKAGLPELIKVVGKMNAAVSLAQDNALEAYDENPSEANYLAAADAIAAAQASVDAYTEGKKALDRVDELLAKTNVYTDDAFMAFGEANLAAQKGYDDGTWTNEEAQSYGPTVFGRPNDWRGANTIQDLLLSAFDVHGGDYDHGYYINTWSTEGDNDGSGYTTPFIEYWTGDDAVLNDFTIHAQMTGLEAGVYTVTALVRQRLSNGYDVTTPVEGLGLGVCEWEVIPSSGEINVENTRFFIESIEAQGEVFADGVLDINFIVKSANCSWVSIKDVKFEKTGAPTGINSVEEADVEGLKDGKYLIKGQIVIVRNGKQYNAAGSLQK